MCYQQSLQKLLGLTFIKCLRLQINWIIPKDLMYSGLQPLQISNTPLHGVFWCFQNPLSEEAHLGALWLCRGLRHVLGSVVWSALWRIIIAPPLPLQSQWSLRLEFLLDNLRKWLLWHDLSVEPTTAQSPSCFLMPTWEGAVVVNVMQCWLKTIMLSPWLAWGEWEKYLIIGKLRCLLQLVWSSGKLMFQS